MSGKVFRIQDPQGRGPFRPGFTQNWISTRADHKNLLPWYVEFGAIDQKLNTGEWGGCACRTIKQLQRWFTHSEYKKLTKFGYKAVMMDVDRVIAESDIQCFVGRTKPLNMDVVIVHLY